jgi:hypothetical protein
MPDTGYPPCPRCGSLQLWRDRERKVRCTMCDPARAYYLITERIRAIPPPIIISEHERAVRFLHTARAFTATGQPLQARHVIAAAKAEGISPATLTRARWHCRLRAVKTKYGWIWKERPR